MTQQLSLFPNSSLNSLKHLQDKKFVEFDATLSPVDEVFTASTQFRANHKLMDLLDFIARFPNYSAFNCFLLYLQDSSATYLATARTWSKKFNRQISQNARPLVILAPMAPIRFVFDIRATEGSPMPSNLQSSAEIGNQLSAKVYSNVQLNCSLQGIAVREAMLGQNMKGTTDRLTPALRKKYKDLNIQKDTNYLIHLNKSLNLELRYASLAHELGHIFCGHLGIDRNAWWPEREDLNISEEEIEAACVAYLVVRRKGLKACLAKYLSEYLETNQKIPAFSLNSVLQAVNYIEEMGKHRWKEPRKRRRN